MWWESSPQFVNSWTGYDGSPNVEEVTTGLVKYMDLSRPQNFSRKWDWVLSLEVGEHIPIEFENNFLSNLVSPAKEGIVLSWATRGQTGWRHVNNLNNPEVVERMAALGFYPDHELWAKLKDSATFWWFQETLMVFKPNVTLV